MSKKKTKKISPTIGMQHWAQVGPEVGISTRVTGRNLGALTYIVSLEAERMKQPRQMTIFFAADGHLRMVHVSGADGTEVILPGERVALAHKDVEATPWDNFHDDPEKFVEV